MTILQFEVAVISIYGQNSKNFDLFHEILSCCRWGVPFRTFFMLIKALSLFITLGGK